MCDIVVPEFWFIKDPVFCYPSCFQYHTPVTETNAAPSAGTASDCEHGRLVPVNNHLLFNHYFAASLYCRTQCLLVTVFLNMKPFKRGRKNCIKTWSL